MLPAQSRALHRFHAKSREGIRAPNPNGENAAGESQGVPSRGDTETKKPERATEARITLMEGPQRCGKTLLGVIRAYRAYLSGRRVFSTIHLEFPHRPVLFRDLKLASETEGDSIFRDAHIFIDELNFWFDCRNSLTKRNKEFSYFLLQRKKEGCNLEGTTHAIHWLDLRIESAYDYSIHPTVYPKFPDVPKVMRLVVENGPVSDPVHRKAWLNDVRPFLGLYDTRRSYDPFEGAGK